MNHQPFEEWLLSDDELNPEEEQALQDHLRDCQECPQLEEAWHEARDLFQAAPQVDPTPGFANRWESRLQAEKAYRQHRQVLRVLMITSLGVLAGAGILIAQNWQSLPTPLDVLTGLIVLIASLIEGVKDLGLLIHVLADTLPPVVMIGGWVALSLSLVFWVAVWLLVVWKLPVVKRSVA